MKRHLSTALGVLICGSFLFLSSCGGGGGSSAPIPGAGTLSSLAISPLSPVLYKGMTAQFSATGTYSNGRTANLTSSVTWTSSNSSVATINTAGLLTSLATGTATITAISSAATGTRSADTTLTVNEVVIGAASVMKTGQTATYATNDDGSQQAGAASPSPRFTNLDKSVPVSGNVVLDGLTGLVWTRDAKTPAPGACANPGQSLQWNTALQIVACLNTNSYLGFSDWRLPNRRELKTLVNHGTADSAAWLVNEGSFTNVQTTYWSSSTYRYQTGAAWDISFNGTNEGWHDKMAAWYVWPVRAGQQNSADPAYPANSIKTGQTTSYYAGDDGDVRYGVAWPALRFTNPDGTTPLSGSVVLDLLTGLTWTKNANATGPAACNTGSPKSWQTALDFVACLNANNYLGYSDWRLPNVNELESLVNLEQWDSSSWLRLQGFDNVQQSVYWSSTTDVTNTTKAWSVNMFMNYPSSYGKGGGFYVWPVRSGS